MVIHNRPAGFTPVRSIRTFKKPVFVVEPTTTFYLSFLFGPSKWKRSNNGWRESVYAKYFDDEVLAQEYLFANWDKLVKPRRLGERFISASIKEAAIL